MKTTVQGDRSARPGRLQPAVPYARKRDHASRWSRGRRVRPVAVRAAVLRSSVAVGAAAHTGPKALAEGKPSCPPPPRATRCRLMIAVRGRPPQPDQPASDAQRRSYERSQTLSPAMQATERLKDRERVRGGCRVTVHRACRLAATRQTAWTHQLHRGDAARDAPTVDRRGHPRRAPARNLRRTHER